MTHGFSDAGAAAASRAALAMDNVRLYEQEHAVADTLQRSLLPVLPEIPGIEAAAHYVSASTAADVGGDFYDLLHLPDGSIGIVVGDVVGHDSAAAAAMGATLVIAPWGPTRRSAPRGAGGCGSRPCRGASAPPRRRRSPWGRW